MATNSEVVIAYRHYCATGEGKSAWSGSHMSYFNHDFYSYTTLVAQYHPESGLLLATSRRYSNTTEQHLRALNPDLRVPEFTRPQDPANVEHLIAEAKSALEKCAAGLVHASRRWGEYLTWKETLWSFCEKVGVPFPEDRVTPQALLSQSLLTRLIAKRLTGVIEVTGGTP